jgi:hypothetical protein
LRVVVVEERKRLSEETYVGVDIIDAGVAILNEDLAVLKLGEGLRFGVLQLRGVACFREDDGPHG